MPDERLLRPLVVDWFHFAWPILVGLSSFYLGRYFHRWSASVRAALVGLTVGLMLIATASLFHFMPRQIEILFSHVGGITVFLCWMILGVMGISWSNPDPNTDIFLRIMAAAVPLLLIAIESSGSLWFRHKEQDAWYNFAAEKGDGTLRQSTASTCLPACGVMLLHANGVFGASEGELAYLSNTTFFGTEAHALARAITAKIGDPLKVAEARFATYDDCRDAGSVPFIAQIRFGNLNHHSVLITKIEKDSLIWVDPLARVSETKTRVDFEKRWTGIVIWVRSK